MAIALQIARCLSHFHKQGLLHRDIKPSNVGFTATGQLKILDFGLSTVLDSPPGEDTDTTIAGTPLYLPPEAFDGALPAASFDLWAVGLVLYESLAGEHPLRSARSFDDALARLRKGPIPDVPNLQARLPRRHRGLPAERPRSVLGRAAPDRGRLRCGGVDRL